MTSPWDSHCHIWERWPYPPAVPDPTSRGIAEQLLKEMDDNDVQHALIVCASIGGNPGNVAYAASVRARYPDRISVLADVDCLWHETYHKPGSADRLRLISDRFDIAGVTHYLYDENDGWLSSDECDQFLSTARERGLLVSMSLGPAWFDDLHKAALRHPAVTFLVHHLGQTRRDAGSTGAPAGLDKLLACAQAPNVRVKVSGFYYHVQPMAEHGGEYPYPEARDVFGEIYGAFGVGRLVWGSDYPVSRMYCTYRQSLDVLRRHSDFLSEGEQSQILRSNLETLLTSRQPQPGGTPASVMFNDELVTMEANKSRTTGAAENG